jgi:hypothetical protein
LSVFCGCFLGVFFGFSERFVIAAFYEADGAGCPGSVGRCYCDPVIQSESGLAQRLPYAFVE